MGAFLIHDLTPGPMIFYTHAEDIYAIFAGFLLTDLLLLIIAGSGFRFWIRIASVPRHFIFPCVTIFAFAGAFTANQNLDDVPVLIGLTVLGYGMRLVGFNPAVFIIGFILTPFLEQNLDQALAIVDARTAHAPCRARARRRRHAILDGRPPVAARQSALYRRCPRPARTAGGIRPTVTTA